MLNDLIKRLEKATGPDRGLADKILLMCGHVGVVFGPNKYASMRWQDAKGNLTFARSRPDPLLSVDVALSLIPEHFERQTIKTRALAYTSGKKFKFECREPSEFGWSQGPEVFRGDHDLETHAICIACLKALSSLKESGK